MDNLNFALDSARRQDTELGETKQQLRASFSLSMGEISSVNQDDRVADVWLMDEKKIIPTVIAIHADYTSMFSSLKVGDYVLVLHKAGLGALIVLKIANDRLTSRKSNEHSKLNQAVSSAWGGA